MTLLLLLAFDSSKIRMLKNAGCFGASWQCGEYFDKFWLEITASSGPDGVLPCITVSYLLVKAESTELY